MDHGVFPNVTYAHTTSKNACEICKLLKIEDIRYKEHFSLHCATLNVQRMAEDFKIVFLALWCIQTRLSYSSNLKFINNEVKISQRP